MLITIDKFLSAHAEIVMWIIIIAFCTISLFISNKCFKFAYKKNLQKIRDDLKVLDEAEQQENQTFRAGIKKSDMQSYEEWKAERQKQEP